MSESKYKIFICSDCKGEFYASEYNRANLMCNRCVGADDPPVSAAPITVDKNSVIELAPYHWIITTDHLDGSANGVSGPHNADPKLSDNPVKFQMFDDDNELYYSGVLYGKDATGFEPLDDYGTPNDGCTIIKINGEIL